MKASLCITHAHPDAHHLVSAFERIEGTPTEVFAALVADGKLKTGPEVHGRGAQRIDIHAPEGNRTHSIVELPEDMSNPMYSQEWLLSFAHGSVQKSATPGVSIVERESHSGLPWEASERFVPGTVIEVLSTLVGTVRHGGDTFILEPTSTSDRLSGHWNARGCIDSRGCNHSPDCRVQDGYCCHPGEGCQHAADCDNEDNCRITVSLAPYAI